MLAIIKKELKSYFLSPIGWIYIGMFLTFCSLFFFTDIFRYKSSAFSDLFGITVSVLSVLIPILTMRTFAEERKNKTDQILLTAPISVREIVLGKFIGASIVVIISALSTFVYYFILMYFGKQGKNRKREHTPYNEIRKDIIYIIRKIFGLSMIFSAVVLIAIICISYMMYNRIIMPLEYILGIIAVMRIYNNDNSICI